MRYLGIDGGGTGCRAACADAAGQVLGRGSGGPANIATDPDGALVHLLDAARAALGPADPQDVVAVLGLAGANLPDRAAWLAARLPFARVDIRSDAEIALVGAHDGADGIVATLGTGSVYGIRRDGGFRTIGGWGFVLGDEASGAWIGRAAMAAALRALDGLGPMTPLLSAVLDAEGGAAAMVGRAFTAPPAAFARHAPEVLRAAGRDVAADAILAAADAQVCVALDHLLAEGPLPVCFLGGLGPAFAARLSDRYAGLVCPPRGDALAGALHLARALGPA